MEQLTVLKRNAKCNFCGTCRNDCLTFGPIYKLEKIIAHYYCLLLSNRLIQNGSDDEGILGFLLSDILKELQRTSNILCVYCKRGNATITCAFARCRKTFHLPCGLKKGTSHQFVYQFKSFCHIHRLIQNIPEKILRNAFKTAVICCICQEEVNIRIKSGFLWAPCCRKTWYHRICVQKLAQSAGYFCRCPACNDAKKFNEWMQQHGIFIPQQDASWELVPNAFEELLFRYNKCDAEDCKCPGGRKTNKKNTMWEIVLCDSCGSQGIHVGCGNLKFLDPEWECPTCEKVTSGKYVAEVSDSPKAVEGSSEQLKFSKVRQKKRRRSSEELENSVLDKRKKFRANLEEEEEETEVDVETVVEEAIDDKTLSVAVDKSKSAEESCVAEVEEVQITNPDEILTLLKPGPLSYKLSVLRKVLEDSLMPSEVHSEKNEEIDSDSPDADLIDLSKSDGETAIDSDIEVIEDVTIHRKEKNPETSCCSVTSSEEVVQKMNFSLTDFEVVGCVSFKPTEERSDCSRGLFFPTLISRSLMGSSNPYVDRLTTFSDPGAIFPLYPGQHNEAEVTGGKKLVKPSDDDVIILID